MIDVADVRAARARLAGIIAETPCPYSETLSAMTGARVHVKLENLQMTGSFKERGAANLLLQLSPDERRRGVVAASAGNHGLAVAFHAAQLGISAVIVMPEWAPLAKVTSARRHGAEVVLHGENFDEAYARAREIEAERGLVFVHPFDDAAGHRRPGHDRPRAARAGAGAGRGAGAGGRRRAHRRRRRSRSRRRGPAVRVIGVQAAEIAAMQAALAGGHARRVPAATTIADGIAVRRVGEQTLALARRYVDEVVTVGEEEIANAILLLLEIEKTVVEGAGAVAAGGAGEPAGGPRGADRGAGALRRQHRRQPGRPHHRARPGQGRAARAAGGAAARPARARWRALTAVVAEARANVLGIEHDRAFSRHRLGDSEVELTLETSGREQIEAIKRQLAEAGYVAEEVGPA